MATDPISSSSHPSVPNRITFQEKPGSRIIMGSDRGEGYPSGWAMVPWRFRTIGLEGPVFALCLGIGQGDGPAFGGIGGWVDAHPMDSSVEVVMESPARSIRWCLIAYFSMIFLMPLGVGIAGTAVQADGQAKAASPLLGAGGLPLVAKGRTLEGVLGEITTRTGVRFSVGGGLGGTPVHVTLDGENWNRALLDFLGGYNRMVIVDGRGLLRRVWITGIDAGGAAASAAGKEEGGWVTVSGPTEPPGKRPFELPVALWRTSPNPETTRGELPAMAIEVDPETFDSLEVGQPVELVIPQEAGSLFAVVEETHDQLNGAVKVFSGPVDGSHDTASFTISRGERSTYVTVATGANIYEVTIDNATGKGTVVDEVEMTRGKDGNDAIMAPEGGVRAP